MLQFLTVIKRFDKQGEKTGWTYIEVPASMAGQLIPGNKKAFRVKGFFDDHPFSGISLAPMGGGNFILPLNATIRKMIRKGHGAMLKVSLELDYAAITPPADLVDCLKDEPVAHEYFNSIAGSHRRYFINWINAAKTDATRTKRIAMALNAFCKRWDYGQMIRAAKIDRDDLYAV